MKDGTRELLTACRVVRIGSVPGNDHVSHLGSNALSCQVVSRGNVPFPVVVVLCGYWLEEPKTLLHVLADDVDHVQLIWPEEQACLSLEQQACSMRMCLQKCLEGVLQ